MYDLETLTEKEIGTLIGDSNLRKSYARRSGVRHGTRNGNTLSAQVQGGSLYKVEIMLGEQGLNAKCTCSWGSSGNCKHVGAVLLRWVGSKNDFRLEEIAAEPEPQPGQAIALRTFAVAAAPTQHPAQMPEWTQKSFAQEQAHYRQVTLGLLSDRMAEELRAIARTHDWVIKGIRKADMAEQLLAQLTDPLQLEKILKGLDAEHLRVLWAIAILGHFPTLQSEDYERVISTWGGTKKHVRFDTYLRHLADRGLISYQENSRYYGVALATMLPVLVQHLPPLLAEALPGERDLPATLPAGELRHANPSWVTRSVAQLLPVIEQTHPPLRPPMSRPYLERIIDGLKNWDYEPAEISALEHQGQKVITSQSFTIPPPAPALLDEMMTQLAPLVGGTEQLEFLLALLTQVGLLQPGSPLTVWPEVKAAFFQRSEAQQRALLIRQWFIVLQWHELWPTLRQQPALRLLRKGQQYNYGVTPNSLNEHVRAFRQLVLATLTWLPNNQWINVAELNELLKNVMPQFDQGFWSPTGRSPNAQKEWYLTYAGRPLKSADNKASVDKASVDKDWQVGAGSFVNHLLSGPLHWLGLADIYVAKETAGNETVLAFRLHGLSELYLNQTETLAAASGTMVTTLTTDVDHLPPAHAVQVTGELIRVVPSMVVPQAHSLLDRLAHLENTQPSQFTYRLDAALVHRSFEAGATLDELLSGWQQLLSDPVPASVQAQLTRWWQSYGQVRLYRQVSMIEFGDDHALTEMKAITSLNTLMLAEISPRLVMIPQSAVKQLTSELEKAGYTPQVIGEPVKG